GPQSASPQGAACRVPFSWHAPIPRLPSVRLRTPGRPHYRRPNGDREVGRRQVCTGRWGLDRGIAAAAWLANRNPPGSRTNRLVELWDTVAAPCADARQALPGAAARRTGLDWIHRGERRL